MTRNLTAQVVSLTLSVLVTVCTLVALDSLAGRERAGQAQQFAAAASQRV
ncbi:MAG TPA: hypothetical protein VML58_07775 [Burkholderiaceae bacterium]|nr:hypothetical protein [Burkholderiaceae bacterium]